MRPSNVRCYQEGRVADERPKLCGLSLRSLCNQESIPKRRLERKQRDVDCQHKQAEGHRPRLYRPIHHPALTSLTSPIFTPNSLPKRGRGGQAGRLGWGRQSTLIALEDKMCLQKQTIIIQKLRSVCRKSLSHLNLHPAHQRGQGPFDYQTKYF